MYRVDELCPPLMTSEGVYIYILVPSPMTCVCLRGLSKIT